MILGFGDFLTENAVVIILILLGIILGTVGYLKRNVLSKYFQHEEEDQTPEEILQDELDSLLVTEKYNPTAKKQKNKSNEYDEEDDFDYDNQQDTKIKEDDFVMSDTSSYSFSPFSQENEENK